MRILISDAISHNRENLASYLIQSGFEVVGTTALGSETLQLAQESKPDIIILDINLPDVDAQETITSLRCSQPAAEVILLMVSRDPAVEQLATQTGVYTCLAKNEGINPLVEAIQKIQKTKIKGERNE